MAKRVQVGISAVSALTNAGGKMLLLAVQQARQAPIAVSTERAYHWICLRIYIVTKEEVGVINVSTVPTAKATIPLVFVSSRFS